MKTDVKGDTRKLLRLLCTDHVETRPQHFLEPQKHLENAPGNEQPARGSSSATKSGHGSRWTEMDCRRKKKTDCKRTSDNMKNNGGGDKKTVGRKGNRMHIATTTTIWLERGVPPRCGGNSPAESSTPKRVGAAGCRDAERRRRRRRKGRRWRDKNATARNELEVFGFLTQRKNKREKQRRRRRRHVSRSTRKLDDVTGGAIMGVAGDSTSATLWVELEQE